MRLPTCLPAGRFHHLGTLGLYLFCPINNFFRKKEESSDDMDKYKRHETEKRDCKYTKIINIHRCTRIRCCTSERVIYEVTANNLWLLEDVVKEFEEYTRNSDEKYIPQDRASLRKSIKYHEWKYREHHDTSPPAELTRNERISIIKPCPCHILVGRISEIGEIERTRYCKHRLNDNTRDKPIMVATKTAIQRKTLENIVQYKERHDDIVSRNTERISEVNSTKKEDKKWYPVRENSFHKKIIAKTCRNKKKVFVFSQKIG